MAKNRGKDSLADVWIKRLKSNRIFAIFFVLVFLLVGAASVTDSFDKLERFASRIWRKPEALTTVPPESAFKPESKSTNQVTSSKSIEQTTTGNNSSAVADVQGDVIIQQQNQK
jgi:hypothetical protein